jgi:hypothetical protein
MHTRDDDVDTTTSTATTTRRFPVSELIRTYLQQTGRQPTGAPIARLGTRRPERPRPTNADELWDYLGDFA